MLDVPLPQLASTTVLGVADCLLEDVTFQDSGVIQKNSLRTEIAKETVTIIMALLVMNLECSDINCKVSTALAPHILRMIMIF